MITGDDYIQFAGRLAARRNADEATYRSAVSRAYYGAFHLADALLSSLGFNVPKGASAHGWIPQALISSGCQEAADAGHLLQDLHAERITADYRWEKRATGSQHDAKASVETAHELQALLDVCGREPMQSQFKHGVKSYL